VAHCHGVDEALRGAVVVMHAGRTAAVAAGAQLTGCELIDDKILECTKANLEQSRNRDFVVGDPGAVLVVELRHEYRPTLEALLGRLESDLRAAGLGYAYPLLFGSDGDQSVCGRVRYLAGSAGLHAFGLRVRSAVYRWM
jgi:hypothetical protein